MGSLSPTQVMIRSLAEEKDVLILAHNYQVPEVQQVADIVGDSLVLAMKARETDRSVILFCGVDFMAEAAKALNPDRTVVHPVPGSICPMAHMIDVDSLREFRKDYPGVPVVAYVNTTASVKAESDICCTSANAVKVVRSLPGKQVIFVPDSNLALYVQSQVPEKEVIPWAGYCHVHQGITSAQIVSLKAAHPDAVVLVHPECTPEVIAMADVVASTEGMIKHAIQSAASEFIVGTEEGLAYRMSVEIPGKRFYAIKEAICPNMKKIRIADVLKALQTLSPTVELDQDLIERNKIPLERMLAVK